MTTVRHALGLGLVMAALAAATAAFSTWPAYRSLGDDQAVLKISFSHLGARVGACRPLTEAELAARPSYDRTTEDCPRGRLPVAVEVILDEAVLFQGVEQAAGFSGDGTARFYHRATAGAGTHELRLRLRDTDRTEGFDYDQTTSIDLVPGQVLVIGFEGGRFTFR